MLTNDQMSIQFSIIVPVYRVEEYLRCCIDSLLRQVCSSYEIILVDDGSPDNCPRICDEYAAAHGNIRVIHKPNGGLVSARKAGTAIAKGRYICCVDGDDFVDDSFLSEISRLTEQYEPDVVCFDYYTYSPEKRIKANAYKGMDFGVYDRQKIEELIFPKLITAANGSCFLPTVWSKVFRRELYEKYQMAVDDRITIGEDRACTVPILSHADTLYISDLPLYYYRTNYQSMTKGRKRYEWDNQRHIADVLYRETDRGVTDFQEQMYRRIVRGMISTARSRFNGGERYRFVKEEIRVQMDDPFFAEAIGNCRFKRGSIFRALAFCLRRRWVFPLFLLNRLS